MDAVFAVVAFADLKRPSIGISTILAEAKNAGFSALTGNPDDKLKVG